MFAIPISQIDPKQLSELGSKAASLVRLRAAKAEVPEAFVLMDAARQAFFAANQLGPVIESELSRLQVEELHSIDYASRVLREAIVGGTFSAELETELLQQYAHTNAVHACVRSSAFASTGFPDAWSAELHTEINVTVDNLLQVVKQCWASCFSARSLYLAASHRISAASVKHHLVVQRMIPAQAAGLLYTSHPVHRDPNLLVIEAGLGLGEAIEHGHVVPDTYTLTKKPLDILEKHVVEQASRLVAAEQGTTVEAMQPVREQKLSDKEILDLAKQALRLEKAFNAPLCLEWAWDDKPYFLQAREMSLGA